MSLSVIVGKPGSGKSYFAVTKIAEFLCQCARFENRSGSRFSRVIYTNLFLNYEECDKYVKNNTGFVFDSSSYLKCLDSSFFYEENSDTRKKSPISWWENFPEEAFIIIDEVHQLIPAKGAGDRDFMEEFVNYLSTHRHKKQDLIFITQHSDNMHRSILSMATDCYQILNIKNRVIPWLGIPLADLDVIKEAWGVKNQVANIIYGNFVGRSFKKESMSTIVLSPEIYALYTSNTLSGGESGDRPSFQYGRIGSIFWFVRKHIIQLSFKAALVYGIIWGIRYILTEGPGDLAAAMVPQSAKMRTATEEEKNLQSVRGSVVSPSVSDSIRLVSESSENGERSERLPLNGVYVYGRSYIIWSQGRLEVGEKFIKDGLEYILDDVNFIKCTYKIHVVSSAVSDGVQCQSVGEIGGAGPVTTDIPEVIGSID